MEAPDPIARALAQPHIVQAICSHLPKKSLGSASLVNRDFFNFATEEKWFAGSLSTLALRTQISRRQLFASKVRRLVMTPTKMVQYSKAFRRIQFSGLKYLSLVSYSGLREEDEKAAIDRELLHRYLQPQLTHLVLRKSRITDLFLHEVESTCQNLRSLRLDLLWAHYTDEALAALIAANPLLEHLRVKPRDRENSEAFAGDELHPLTDDVMDATLLQCARQRKLLSLRIGTDVILKPEPFQRICDQVPEPFPLLREFSGYVPSMAAPLLGQWCKHMHQLDMVFDDSEVPVLREISKMKNLRSMEIDLASGATICSLDMVSLQALSKLEVFSLICEDKSWPQLPLACDDFQKWMASFPNLNVFELEVNIGRHDHCTDGCLATLSRGWSRLERLTWPGIIHFGKLDLEDSTMPLFPNLEDLTVENATVSKDNQWVPKSVP
ncbi:uncharacterized protein BBA_03970 [Beauveria bassiana ARSEF 2860]|uniref:F-box domain-containing protein n=1 Tax=Beauveria bassiana (strain ARSEF 2860) TaxID=655819 RepID=J5JZ28_BEAB2|nr:uncharacterized protein BBA_03970 [Beauveria bassiana ARSEF 2860]EJP67396.1 hypothetical protein BBA_03970 [Beauveria bassiana ARSEF 2860]